MNAWTPVKVIDESLERFGQAGVVQSAAPTITRNKKGEIEAQTVDVKMDLDGSVETFTIEPKSQLQALA